MTGKRANGEGSLYQSQGRWYAAGYIDGKRRKVSRPTQSGARAAWKELLKQEALGAPRRGAPQTITQLLEDWFALKQPDLAYKTRVSYRGAIDHHLVPHLGKTSIRALSIGDIERWQSSLLTEQDLAASTVRTARIVLSQAMNMAVRHGDLTANPVALAAPIRKPKKVVEHLTLDETLQLLASVDTPSAWARLLLALCAGMRQGELLALRWDAVTLDGPGPHLIVQTSLHRETGKGLVESSTKTPRSRRRINLPPELVEALKAVKAEQNRTRLALGDPTYNARGFVFTTGYGTPVDPANDSKHWHRWLDDAGVRSVRVHSSRHTTAALMLENGATPIQVQTLLGHTSIRTTVDLYGHLADDLAAAAVTDLAHTLGAARCSSPVPTPSGSPPAEVHAAAS